MAGDRSDVDKVPELVLVGGRHTATAPYLNGSPVRRGPVDSSEDSYIR